MWTLAKMGDVQCVYRWIKAFRVTLSNLGVRGLEQRSGHWKPPGCFDKGRANEDKQGEEGVSNARTSGRVALCLPAVLSLFCCLSFVFRTLL